jgi:hypothetical protein
VYLEFAKGKMEPDVVEEKYCNVATYKEIN